jgi:hypothetical protein
VQLDVGYNRVHIDDCWAAMDRSANGSLVPDPTRFPNGIDGLAQYVHDRGLLLGLYGDDGTQYVALTPSHPSPAARATQVATQRNAQTKAHDNT